jgi:hypothetical protein
MKPLRPLAAISLLLAAVPAVARDKQAADPAPAPSLEQAMMLRCSAAFAIVAGDQARGIAPAKAYPPLAERGKKFFVAASAQLMDEMHVDHDAVEAMLRDQVDQLQQGRASADDPAAYVDAVMQPCLEELVANGF